MSELKEKKAFTVRYVRQGTSNEWVAKIEARDGLEDANFTGFVAYSTAFWGNEDPSNVPAAFVTILVEYDSRPETKAISLHAAIDDAVRQADLHFKQHHPNASVKYEDFDLMQLF